MSGRGSHAAAEKRRARYIKLRREGVDKWEAAQEVGVQPTTGRRYERFFQVAEFGRVLPVPPRPRIYSSPFRT